MKWQLVSGSDHSSPCTLCGELTQNHFWGSFKEGQEDFAMAYFFCGEDCLEKLRQILNENKYMVLQPHCASGVLPDGSEL